MVDVVTKCSSVEHKLIPTSLRVNNEKVYCRGLSIMQVDLLNCKWKSQCGTSKDDVEGFYGIGPHQASPNNENNV
jgi:hypothetical protein